ncbi:MAG: hypothetical protein ACR2M4_05620 [Actinomycetota bacterium]
MTNYRVIVGAVKALFEGEESALKWARDTAKRLNLKVTVERGYYDTTGNGTQWIPDVGFEVVVLEPEAAEI